MLSDLYTQLDDLLIHLQGDDQRAIYEWTQFFDAGIVPARHLPAQPRPHLRLRALVVPALPALPASPPFFSDYTSKPGDHSRLITAHQAGRNEVLLHFARGALLRLPTGQRRRGAREEPPAATIHILPQLFHDGRFEDVTMVALATLLRPYGYFMCHAFATTWEEQAILLVGQQSSGKTTTGLRLVAENWGYLGNDAILLQQQGEQVCALPSPGGISFAPETVEMLPHLRPLAAQYPVRSVDGKHHVPPQYLVQDRRARSAPIKLVCFPEVAPAEQGRLEPMPQAVGLAHLMAQSMDRWDRATFDAHLSLLHRLSRQAAFFRLFLGQGIEAVPAWIRQALAATAS